VKIRQANRMAGAVHSAVLSIVKIRHAQFGEEEHSQNKVNHGKDHIIDNRFDLGGCVRPSAFNGTSHIPGSCRKCGYRKHDGQHHYHYDRTEHLFRFHHQIPPFFIEKRKAAGRYTPAVQRSNLNKPQGNSHGLSLFCFYFDNRLHGKDLSIRYG